MAMGNSWFDSTAKDLHVVTIWLSQGQETAFAIKGTYGFFPASSGNSVAVLIFHKHKYNQSGKPGSIAGAFDGQPRRNW